MDKIWNNDLIIKIVLAAGLSKRYGFKNKLAEKINDKPIILNTINSLQSKVY